MPAIALPDLKRKFALLRTYPKPKTWPELAEPFGVSFKALQFWQDGNDTRDPDYLPDWAVPILTRLIGEILPGVRSADDVRQFVFGPASVLDEELRTGAASSMMALIAREGVETSIGLIPKPDGIELIEVETKDPIPRPRIRLGAWFRIVVRRRRLDGHALTLQHAQGTWALVPTIDCPRDPRSILMPGIDADGDPAFMRERRDPGRHLFACLETPNPPPAHVMAHGRDEAILDKRALDAMAAFFETQPEDRRACHVLHVEFEAADPA